MTERLNLNTSIRSTITPRNTKIKVVERNMPAITEPVICPSKSCVHKHKMKMDEKENKKSKKSKKPPKKRVVVESESESSDSEESSSSSESETSGGDSSDSESSSSASSSSSSSSEDEPAPRKSKKSKTKTKKVKKVKIEKEQPKLSKTKSKSQKIPQVEIKTVPEDDGSSSSKEETADESGPDEIENLIKELESKGLLKKSKNSKVLKGILKGVSKKDATDSAKSMRAEKAESSIKSSKKSDKKDKKVKEKDLSDKDPSKAKYKRLDEIWDESVRDYRLKETNDKKEEDQWEKYVFTVRRKFTVENRFSHTIVEIKSAFLKECLKVVMEGVEGVSLVEKVPRLMPDMLFLYLDDYREYVTVLNTERKKCDDKKVKKTLKIKAQHLGALIKYLDKDYDEMKKTLYPMLDNGTITFDLLWALYKPNSLAYSTMYGDEKQPRAFKIDSAYKERHCMRGPYYSIEGKYFDFDGERFGSAFIDIDIYQFQGARKITSLPCYPLRYHQNEEILKKTLIERGKKFLTLAGMKYKFCQGTCYFKKDQKILKTNVNGRVMVDPKTFRRINPNYPLSDVEARDVEDENEECKCEKADSPKKPEPPCNRLFVLEEKEEKDKDKDEKNKEMEVIEISTEDERAPDNIVDLVKRTEAAKKTFTEEEVLLASPVLPGFSFSEKLWIELPVSAISEVQWNEGAFDSLVIPEQHKSIVKALVTAHGLHSSKSIDDVVSGKGKGLVAVLHGKPGLGKTLTCEAISDLLKRPLYSVTAGDLGTHATNLEFQLQIILDVAHAWGAVLLLDEADVFLEERSTHDVHRNAMVSVFLRMLEYFSGILMMTTNRVETFDDAFVSRIHLSLRYSELTVPARKAIWKTFINKVAQSAAASAGTSSTSESSSVGAPTPETTSSTPNSGAATPATTGESSEHPPATPTTPMSTHSTTSVDSVESDKTVTPSPSVAQPDSTPTPTATSAPSNTTSTSSSSSASPAVAGIERITEANYLELARVDLNGRQIKNLVKTAQALALYEGVPMGMSHLRRCIEVGRSFEMDLKGGRGWEDVMRSYT